MSSFFSRLVPAAAALLVAAPAFAQTQPAEPPPQQDVTTHEEVPAPPESPAPDSDRQQPVETTDPKEHVPESVGAIDLSVLRTDNMALLYFDPGQTYLVPYVARSFENALAFHKKMFNWTPWERTTILLKDFSDYGNAAARSSPNNAILLDVAPLSQIFETFSPGERFFTLTNHEAAHVATMDVWNQQDAGWRKFFGGKPMPLPDHPETILYNFLTTPRVNVPRWYLEGSAVFFETWMAGGLGRAQAGYDEMVWRAKVRDDARFYSPLGLESEGTHVDFQVGVNEYLYGTRFFSYLALTYSPAKVVEWLSRGEDSAAYYSTQFHRVFGKRLDDVWDDWIAFEHQFQASNLAALNQYAPTPVTRLVRAGLGSVSRSYYDPKTNSLVGAFRYLGVIGHVGMLSLDTGKIRRLHDIKGQMLYQVTSLTFDPDARTVFYTEDNYAYRDLVALNVDTGRREMLLRDARIGDLVLDPRDKSIWGIRHQNGYSTLVRIPKPYAGFNQVHTFEYGENPFDIDVSPDGTLISASFGEINGTQSVRVWRTDALEAGEGPVEVARLTLGSSTPEGFVFTPDGKSLYGSAYYTGVSNIFRFDIATQKFDAVSNAETGFFRPIPQADGSLIVYEYTGDGFAPVRIVPKPLDDLGTITFLGAKIARERPEVKTWGVGSPAKVPLDEMITGRGKYVLDKERKLAVHYPVVESYLGDVALGYHAIFEDPLQLNQLLATVSVSPTTHGDLLERLHVDLELKTLNWNFRYWHNDADFYDLFGPVERSRKGDAFIIGFKQSKIYDPPRQLDIFADAAVYIGLEQLPNAQNVPAFGNLFSSEAGARYTNVTRSLGSIDREKGIEAEVIGGMDYAEGDFYPRLRAGLNAGIPLPIHNSSVWFYSAAGIIGGERLSPLGSYYFGAFGNNYVDNRSVQRYRDYDSFPGFEINEIDARKFGKLIGEWNLPPLRFAEVGTASFYLSSVRTAVFGGALAVERPAGGSQTYETLGIQFDFNFTVALRLPMTLSLGAARGFSSDHSGQTEWLASLKIL
jgi:hypothetical protein